MNCRHRYLLLSYLTAAFLAGCLPPQREQIPICPGKESAVEALTIMRSRAQNIVPLRANGQCVLEYYVECKKHKENFPIKLWVHPVRNPPQQGADVGHLASNGVNPPVEVYLQGDIAFNPRGLVLGANEREFWLSIKPQDISSYWWGLWSEGSYNEKLIISPKIILEALGMAAADSSESDEKNWSLSKENGLDVLTNSNVGGQIIKKLYISNCDYLIRKIDYFDTNNEATVVAELGKYKEVLAGIFVPATIKITKKAGVNKDDSVKITLNSIKKTEFSEKLRSHLFTRPEPQGFKHIYKVVNGRIVEQLQ